MAELKDGWVSITHPGQKAKIVKRGSKAHANALSAHPEDGRPKVQKVANKGQDLTADQQKALGIPAATKAQPKSDDKAQAKEADK
jgi:hypothetical protein